MVKTRYQIIGDSKVGQAIYKNYGEVVKAIWKEEGLPGFYKGITASYAGCFEGAIQWIVYEKMKTLLTLRKFTESKEQGLGPMDYFAAAGVSKFVAICATYPHEVLCSQIP